MLSSTTPTVALKHGHLSCSTATTNSESDAPSSTHSKELHSPTSIMSSSMPFDKIKQMDDLPSAYASPFEQPRRSWFRHCCANCSAALVFEAAVRPSRTVITSCLGCQDLVKIEIVSPSQTVPDRRVDSVYRSQYSALASMTKNIVASEAKKEPDMRTELEKALDAVAMAEAPRERLATTSGNSSTMHQLCRASTRAFTAVLSRR